ncbi:MAG: MATE family efflux transporter, partial [Clostridia bacterium]|nr:MATE family efflux transporter [Clostridia bacterium]
IYLKILMLGVPFSILFNFCAAVFRTAGETNKPFIYLVISGATNVALNFVFVALFHMGVVGVAIATVVSQVLSSALIVIRLIRNEGLFSFSLKKIEFSWKLFGKMVAVGLPAGLQSCAFSLSNTFLQSGVNTFGKDAMAGSTAIATVEGLMWVTLTSFNNTTTTFVSQNLGAGKLDRAKKAFSYSLLVTGALGIVVGLSAYFLSDPIISIFIKDNPIAFDFARERMSVTFPLYFLAGIMGVLPGAIRGLGSSLPPSLITIFGTCGIRIIWVYTVFKKYPSLNVLYLVHPITWVLTITALAITLRIVYKKAKLKLEKTRKKIYVRKVRRTV